MEWTVFAISESPNKRVLSFSYEKSDTMPNISTSFDKRIPKKNQPIEVDDDLCLETQVSQLKYMDQELFNPALNISPSIEIPIQEKKVPINKPKRNERMSLHNNVEQKSHDGGEEDVSTFPTTRLRKARSIQNWSESTEPHLIGMEPLPEFVSRGGKSKKMTKALDEPLKTLQTRAKKSKIGVKTNKFEPLSSDDSPPQFPSSGSCTWSYDPISYVVLARLHSNDGAIDNSDLECILAMMERHDITLVIEGLSDGLDPMLWSMKGIERRICHTYHHKFAQFHRNIQSTDQINQKQKKRSLLPTRDKDYFFIDIENSAYCSMKLSDYFIYLSKREKALSAIRSKRLEEDLDPVNPISKDDTFGRNPYYNCSSDIDTHVGTEGNMDACFLNSLTLCKGEVMVRFRCD